MYVVKPKQTSRDETQLKFKPNQDLQTEHIFYIKLFDPATPLGGIEQTLAKMEDDDVKGCSLQLLLIIAEAVNYTNIHP